MRILVFAYPQASPCQRLSDNLVRTASELIARDHQVLLAGPPGQLADRMRAVGAAVCESDEWECESFTDSGTNITAYDIIHCYSAAALDGGLQARNRLGVPLFLTVDDLAVDSLQDAWPHCTGVFAVSPGIKRKLLEIAPEATARIHDMPDAAVHPSRVSRKDLATADALRVLLVWQSCTENAKVIESLLEYWAAQVRGEVTRTAWNIVGAGLEASPLREAAEELNRVSGQCLVRFHGQIDGDAIAQLEVQHHVALTSGPAAVAALARGTPTIAWGAAGLFGLVTRENFWQAVDCDFGEISAGKPCSRSNLLAILPAFLSPNFEGERRKADCTTEAQSYFSPSLWFERLLDHYRAATSQTSRASVTPFMPTAEVQHLTRAYAEARVILEYGSGGSTGIAAQMPNKYIMSVESDLVWARSIRQNLSGPSTPSSPIVHHANLGPTGPWGRPMDDREWRTFHSYPMGVWDQKWFRHPDLVLIDGRFRTACLATIMLRAEHPVKVLFDDYGVRPLYQAVESVIRPAAMIGRMAEFHVVPGMARSNNIALLLRQFFWVSVHGTTEQDYHEPWPSGGGFNREGL